MKLYQLSGDEDVYGVHCHWWLVCSDDMEDELAGPFEKREEAEQWIKDNCCPGGCRFTPCRAYTLSSQDRGAQ